jgi:lipopolysaccharide transport system permease protein
LHTRILPPKSIEFINIPEIWRFRGLFVTLALRDIKLRYRQTLFGIVWVVIQPIFSSAVFAIIFGQFGNLPSDEVPYAVLTFVAILPWNLVSHSITRASSSLVKDMRMVTRVYFPRIIVPISSTVSALLDFAVSSVILFIILLIFNIALSWRILLAPLLVVTAWLVAICVGLIISALNVYYRDFQYAISFVLQAWMYISPVAYAASIVPDRFRVLYALNPMVGIVESFRWVFLNTNSFPFLELGITMIFLVVIYPVSLVAFQKIEKHFADVI